MKIYEQLGELLADYRVYHNLSQMDFAARMDVDVRTIIRWEMNQSLIKSEKERDLVEKTFIPYQVIRNLNAAVSIPTFYSFTLRKYALAERSNPLPSANWMKEQMHHTSDRLRSIETSSDIDQILKYIKHHDMPSKRVNPELIKEAARLLPELNLIIFDKAGYYAGHSVILPLKPSAYQKLKEQRIMENQLAVDDLTHFKNEPTPFFHSLEVTADCNENIFYIMGAILKFFSRFAPENYRITTITRRHDSYALNEQLGLKLIWGDPSEPESNETFLSPRFYEGNFNTFFKA